MKRFIFLALASMFFSGVVAQSGYKNPIIPGFHPDPSVCAVGNDYYLVNSSFCYFPGVPLFHSTDLVNWEQIGNVLTRKSQIDLSGDNFWLGIYAPTIRYNKGVFYMIVTDVPKKGNFLVHTTDINGEWSDPVYFKQGGIDPSLYFEGDDCWMVSNPDDGIFLCKVNPLTGEQLTPSQRIWNGTGGRYPEGPHIYKKDGFYYLLISEGGTEYGHKITIARSKDIQGPYMSNPANPILTHINQNAQNNPIQGTGHADFVQAADGSWWMVFLGFRINGSNHHLLGRETFIAPVRWDENAWPVVNGNGTVNVDMKCNTLPLKPFAPKPSITKFDTDKAGNEWVYLRNPIENNYSFTGKLLKIKASYPGLEGQDSPSMIMRRQEHFDFTAEVPVKLNNASENDEAGLTVWACEASHYDIFIKKSGKSYKACLRYRLNNLHNIEKEIALASDNAVLRVKGNKDLYTFYVSADGKKFEELGALNTVYLSTETAGGFCGTMLGIYAQKASDKSKAEAEFTQFEYSY